MVRLMIDWILWFRCDPFVSWFFLRLGAMELVTVRVYNA